MTLWQSLVSSGMAMQEAMRVQLPSPRRSWRSPHKLVEASPGQLFEGPANQTGYDSDDEGEVGGTEDVEDPDDMPEPLPTPQACLQVLLHLRDRLIWRPVFLTCVTSLHSPACRTILS